MSTTAHLLEVRVFLTNGHVETFVQNDIALVRRMLDNMPHPSKLFQSNFLMINGDRSLQAIRTSMVARIDLLTEETPHWNYLHGASVVQEITPEMFRDSFEPKTYEMSRKAAWEIPGRTQAGFTELETADGHRAYWEVLMESKAVTPSDMETFVQSVMNTGGLHAQKLDRGVTITNLANVARIAFYPGPTVMPLKVWNLSRVQPED